MRPTRLLKASLGKRVGGKIFYAEGAYEKSLRRARVWYVGE